jgi:hypothetical protein
LLARTQDEKCRFRFASKSKPCGSGFGWHIHVPMVSSKNRAFLEQANTSCGLLLRRSIAGLAIFNFTKSRKSLALVC